MVVDLQADRPEEDGLETWTRLAFQAGGATGTGRWFAAASAQHVARSGAAGSGAAGAWAVFTPRLDETGWSGPLGPFQLRAGLLDERWGRLDLLPVVDVLSGRDRSAGPVAGAGSDRLAAPAARLQLGGDTGRVDLVVLPFGASDRLSLWGTDWSLVRQGMVEGAVAEAATWEGEPLSEAVFQDALAGLGQGLAALDPSDRGLLSGALGGATGSDWPWQGDVGLRAATEAGGFDLALVGAWLESRVPLLTVDPDLRALLVDERLPTLEEAQGLLAAGLPISASRPHSLMAGAEVGRLLGPIGLRLEGGWWSDRVVQRQWFEGATRPVVATGLGLDWLRSTTQVSLEGRWTHTPAPPQDLWLTAPEQFDLALLLRQGLLRERLRAEVVAAWDASHREHLLQPGLAWRPRDQWELSAAVLLLGGGQAAPTTLQEAATWQGGPLGYWGDNDSLRVGVAWIR